jgi:hypothetical protein
MARSSATLYALKSDENTVRPTSSVQRPHSNVHRPASIALRARLRGGVDKTTLPKAETIVGGR